jgi:ATP-dependent protease HslVU (ClpYQ) peptidase subunit
VTVIAWDGETLAADRRASAWGHVHSVHKLFRLDADRLAGLAGNSARAIEVAAWLARRGPVDEFPEGAETENVTAIVVHRSGEVLRFENRGTGWLVRDPFHAIGSGADFAVAAMACGKTATEAVEITCRFSSECGNGVDTLRFEPVP